jgi:uncharacterized repeat protein (TIGR02059 family)
LKASPSRTRELAVAIQKALRVIPTRTRNFSTLGHRIFNATLSLAVVTSSMFLPVFPEEAAVAAEATGQGGEIVGSGNTGREGYSAAVGSDGKFYVSTNGGVARFNSSGGYENVMLWPGWFSTSDAAMSSGEGFVYAGLSSGGGIQVVTQGTNSSVRIGTSITGEIVSLAYAPVTRKLYSLDGSSLRRFDYGTGWPAGQAPNTSTTLTGTGREVKIQKIGATEYVLVATSSGIFRYDWSGTLDPTFTSISGNFTALAVDPNDGTIYAGTTSNVFRYPANGGVGSAALLATSRSVNSIAVDNKGRFVIGSSTGIYRFSSTGAPDAIFNANANPASPLVNRTIVIASDGRVAVPTSTGSVTLRVHRGDSAAPDAPSITSAVSTDSGTTVTVARGGTKIASSFRVSVVGDGTKFCDVSASTPSAGNTTSTGGSCTVTGLTNGTSYTFIATAYNLDEPSAASAASAPVTPLDNVRPLFQSASVDTTGTKLTMTYNEALNATTAPASAFVVKNGSATIAVTGVQVNGSTVELTLASPIGAGLAASVAYTAPTNNADNSNNAIQDLIGNDAITLATTNVAAGNNLSTVDQSGPNYVANSGTADSTGLKISLTFNETLSETTAEASRFTVANTGGYPVAVSSVDVDGSRLELTL